MSLSNLQAQLMWDAASKGGSADQVARRYNEALQYLMGLQMNRINSSRGRGVDLANMVGTQPNPYLMNKPSRMPMGGYGSNRGSGDY